MSSFDTASIRSSLRFCQVMGDTMSPTIRRFDYVLVSPAHRYVGEGYYLLGDPVGDGAAAYCCSAAGTREEPMILLHCHNRHYRDHLVTQQHFDEHVLAQIVMTCNVVRPDLLDQATRHSEVEA